MSADDPGSYTDFSPPGAKAGDSGQTRLEWVLDETIRSHRFLGAMVVGPDGWSVASRGFEYPDRITALAPKSNQLLNTLKEAFPPTPGQPGRPPGEAASFAGFGEPEGEERSPEYVAVSMGQERKLLFRPLQVQGKNLVLVLLARSLSANTDAVLEGIGRAVTTCLETDWSQVTGT